MASVLHGKAPGLEDSRDLPVVTWQVQGLDFKACVLYATGRYRGHSSCVVVTLFFESGGTPVPCVSKSVRRPIPDPDALAPDPRFSSITSNSLPLGLKGTWDQILALVLIGRETPRRSHSFGVPSRGGCACRRKGEAGECVRRYLLAHVLARHGADGEERPAWHGAPGSRRADAPGTGYGH